MYVDVVPVVPATPPPPYYQECIFNIEGGRVSYFTMGLCYNTLRGHDLCNDIHRLEASVLAICGGVTDCPI